MVALPFAFSHAERLIPGLAEKICRNVYVEKDDADPEGEWRLIETPGSVAVNTFAGACRGMAQTEGHAGGKILIAQGTSVSTYAPATGTVSSLTGTLSGTDRWQVAFTENEGMFLANGGLYVSDGSAFAAVTDADFANNLSAHSQSSFSSVASIGQRFLATFGSRFLFTAVLDGDNTTALSYYTAESASDPLVRGIVLADTYYLFGTRTIEPWIQTGDADDPFRLISGSAVMPVGAISAQSIIEADNTLYWVDENYQVRRLAGGYVSEIVSEPWVTRALKSAGFASIIAQTYSDEGHIFVVYRTPALCAVFDTSTGQWHTRATLGSDTLRWTDYVLYRGDNYVMDGAGQFDLLSRDYASESMANASTMGTEIVREWMSYGRFGEFRAIPALYLKSAKGVGLATGQGSDPVVEMRVSTNQGNTWSSYRSRKLGAQGVYDEATIWRINGSTSRQGAYFQFRKSDPAPSAYQALETIEA